MLDHAYAVILAGGYGERFWPASTMRRPKQLLTLLGERTMLELAVDRLAGLIPAERILVLTNADVVAETVACSPDLPAENVIGEPIRRDTAAAIALACAAVRARDPKAVFCVLTADHVMAELDVFRHTIRSGIELAMSDDVLVTIGITPTHPSTAFGYIEGGESVQVPERAESAIATSDQETELEPIQFQRVSRFVEKPDRSTAEKYVESGQFWWNSGMFIWSCESLYRAFAAHTPALTAVIDELTPLVGPEHPANVRSDAIARVFEPLERISIDYALMEKADNIIMAIGTFGWDDVGSWPEVANYVDTDESNNAVMGLAELLDAKNNLVVSNGHLTALVGVEDLVVVHTDGATLICHKDRAQDVKKIVTSLRERGGFDHLL